MSASTAAAQSPVRSGTARRAGPAALTRLRTGSIILAVLLYAVLAVTATSYIAAGIVRLAWKQPFSSLAASSPNDVLRAWEATADHPTYRRSGRSPANCRVWAY